MRLEWSVPDAGQSCLNENENSSLVFSVFLSQSYPPDFFAATNANYSELTFLNPGLWFWTISAANTYFSTNALEMRFFIVASPPKYLLILVGVQPNVSDCPRSNLSTERQLYLRY